MAIIFPIYGRPLGGGGGSPGGADTNVQFNDAGVFGGNSGFLYNKTTQHVAMGPSAGVTLTNGTVFMEEDFTPAVAVPPNKTILNVSGDLTPSVNITSAGFLNGIFSSLSVHGTHNVQRLFGIENSISYTSSGTANALFGYLWSFSNQGTGVVGLVTGYDADFFNDVGSTVTVGYGFESEYSNSGTVGTYTHFYGDAITAGSGGSLTEGYGIYLDNVTGGSSKNFAVYTNLGLSRFGDHVRVGVSTATTSVADRNTLRIDEDFTPAGVLGGATSLVYARSDYAPSVDQVGIIPALFGYYADIITGGTKNIAQIDGAWFNAEHAGSGILSRSFGSYGRAGNTSTGTTTLANGFRSEIFNTNASGVLTNAMGYYCFFSNSGTITNGFGFYLESVAGAKSYGMWHDEGASQHPLWLNEDGVYAIEATGSQAVPSLHNPGFTKFTSGSANYERSILKWNSNILDFGAQAGGTGTLRPVRFLGDAFTFATGSDDLTVGFNAGVTTFTTTLGFLNASIEGDFPGNGAGLYVTNASNTAASNTYWGIQLGNTAELQGFYGDLQDGSTRYLMQIYGVTTEFRFEKDTLESIDLNLSTANTAIWSSVSGVTLMNFSGMSVKAAGYQSSDGSAGVTAGPFTAITSITIKNGLVVAITGS